MKLRSLFFIAAIVALSALALLPSDVSAHHKWGPYHWARTSNPFTLKLGNNVSSGWSGYLNTASSDWSVSTVLDTTIVAGNTNGTTCAPTSGRVEVCNANYGDTGWLGVAQIWTATKGHIVQGTAKMNDFYFNQSQYNTAPWRRLVMCQEVAHTFGLDHQDENFNNPNLGTCMDYTSDPDGPPSNEHPNQHDYDQLMSIYKHLDKTSTIGATPPGFANANVHAQDNWGQEVRRSEGGHLSLFERDFGGGFKIFTFVIWAQ